MVFFALVGLLVSAQAISVSGEVPIFDFPETDPEEAPNANGVPLAIFHGVGDDCRFPGMFSFTKHLGKTLGAYTKCIEVGNGSEDSWLESMHKQAEQACAEVKADANFANGLNVLGLSQGSLLARSIVEKCDVTVFKLSTMGGPHMGVATIPNCHSGWFCSTVNFFVDLGIYNDLVQSVVGPAGYYKDQYEYKEYLKHSDFLADLNNERSDKNATYKAKISSLEGIQLIKFTLDTVVDPQESEWFGYYATDSKKIQTLNETSQYQDDFLGLKELYDNGKVEFVAIAGQHLQMTTAEVDEFIAYLLAYKMENTDLDILGELALISANYFGQVSELIGRYLRQTELPKQTEKAGKAKKLRQGLEVNTGNVKRELETQRVISSARPTEINEMISKQWPSLTQTKLEKLSDTATKDKEKPRVPDEKPKTPAEKPKAQVEAPKLPVELPISRGKVSLTDLFDESDSDLPKKRRNEGEEERQQKRKQGS